MKAEFELLKAEVRIQTQRETQPQEEFEAQTILQMKTASTNPTPISTTGKIANSPH